MDEIPSIGLSPGMGVTVTGLIGGHAGPMWMVAGCMLWLSYLSDPVGCTHHWPRVDWQIHHVLVGPTSGECWSAGLTGYLRLVDLTQSQLPTANCLSALTDSAMPT